MLVLLHMGRKKKKQVEEEVEEEIRALGERTRGWIFALISFAGALFFVLAAAGRAGLAGTMLWNTFREFFGFGYYLFPSLLVIFGGAFIARGQEAFKFTSLLGGGIFFFSGIGILELALKKGGFLGEVLSTPLLSFFDIYASFVLVGTLFLVSLLLITNTVPSLGWLFRLIKKSDDGDHEEENKEKEITVPIIAESKEHSEKKAIKDNEEPLSEEQEKGAADPLRKIFGFSKTERYGAARLREVYNKNYVRPPLELLRYDTGKPGVGDIKAHANIIKRTLQNFGINVEMDEVSVGPSVTRYALKPAQGVKLSRIVGLKNDLSLALAAHPLRIEAPIPGKSLVGIEIPNTARTTVGLASLLSQEEYKTSTKPLLCALGRGVTGKPHFGNLAKMPHLLLAGATGSGKSVAIHTIVVSLIYNNSPASLRFIMIDPKRVELTLYNKAPHLLTPVITDSKKAILALKWAIKEMERRYDILETESVRDIESYHKNIMGPAYEKVLGKQGIEGKNLALPERMPYIVIIIDELADIMSAYPRELEAGIVRLAQMSRAVGIHLIISTQRPSVNVITGLIKANIPVRMAFQVPSQIDSRTILDMGGAETLLGSGDMLYVSGEMSKPIRLQSAFISEAEIKQVAKFLAKEDEDNDTPSDIMFSGDGSAEEGIDPIFTSLTGNEKVGDDDDLYDEARETVTSAARASTTYLQRKFRIGYARAARLMDLLEERGIVGPADGAKPRQILVREKQSDYTSNASIEEEDTDEGQIKP